jgi:hypothetical protein
MWWFFGILSYRFAHTTSFSLGRFEVVGGREDDLGFLLVLPRSRRPRSSLRGGARGHGCLVVFLLRRSYEFLLAWAQRQFAARSDQGVSLWQQGWPVAHIRLVLRRETCQVVSSVSGAAALGGGHGGAGCWVPCVGAGWRSRLCGERDGLRSFHVAGVFVLLPGSWRGLENLLRPRLFVVTCVVVWMWVPWTVVYIRVKALRVFLLP